MPKDYSKGKVYSIRSKMTDGIYIGSTTQSLSQRMAEHRSQYKTGLNVTTSEHICKYPDAYIELIENYPCNSQEELNKREGEIQREYDNRVNIQISGRTRNEYYKDNFDYFKDKSKKYQEEHKEELKEYNKKYQEEHKEELKEQKAGYYKDNLDYFKDKAANYYEEHKDELIEKTKQYRINNPDCRKKKTICECGCEVLAEGLRVHLKTKKHKQLMEQI
jgi:hypothetical protein